MGARRKTAPGLVIVRVGSLTSAERASGKQQMRAQATFGKEAPTASAHGPGQPAAQVTKRSDVQETEAYAYGDSRPAQRGIKRFGSNPMLHRPAKQGPKAGLESLPARSVRSPPADAGLLKTNSPLAQAPHQKAPKNGVSKFSLAGNKSERHLESLNGLRPAAARDLKLTPPVLPLKTGKGPMKHSQSIRHLGSTKQAATQAVLGKRQPAQSTQDDALTA